MLDRHQRLGPSGLFFGVPLGGEGTPPSLEDVERAYLARILQHFEGHRTAAAQAIGVSYPTLLKRLREFGLDS